MRSKVRNKSQSGDSSPTKRSDLKHTSFRDLGSARTLVDKVNVFKRRGDQIPFGMSKQIWDLVSYQENFEKFKQYFAKVS